jgi:ABC-2 type transport system ATP-binding protein
VSSALDRPTAEILTPADACLRTEGLGKRYGDRWALRDVTLTVPTGRVVALVGENGAGKSTLMEICLGFRRPTNGGLHILGSPMPADGDRVRPMIGFVAEDHPLYENLSVSQILEYGRLMNPEWDAPYAAGRLNRLGVAGGQAVRQLSGGQRAQVALTLALAKRPRLLVLDEPVARVDPLARQAFYSQLSDEVRARGLSVIISSHILAELTGVADHIILLSHGKKVLDGPVADLAADHRILVLRSVDPRPLAGKGVVASLEGEPPRLLVRRTEFTGEMAGREGRAPTLEELALGYLTQAAIG